MPTVEKTRGNRVRIRGLGRLERGDRVEVGDEMATHLTEARSDFEIVDEDSDSDEETAADSDDDTDSEGFDVDEWLGQDYQDRADAVRDGEVDDHLDEIDEAETSGTVRDAIGERRAELED